MIKRLGNLFDTDATCIGHGVNCRGVMGHGIAVEFKKRFPTNYEKYRDWCKRELLHPGTFAGFEDGDKIIFNIASQDNVGKDARYDWLFEACRDAAKAVKAIGHDRIAIPLIGCGIGGLEWVDVECLLHAVEILTPGFEFEVWKLSS